MKYKNLFDQKKYDEIIAKEKYIQSHHEEDMLALAKSHYEVKNYDKVKYLIDTYIHEHKYYYDYLILKLNILLIEQKYVDAALILKEELNMPYIEEKYRVVFEDMFQIILEKKYHKNLEVSDIEQLLTSSEDNQILGLTLLKKQNIREYYDIISEILSSNKYSLKIKNLLLMAMFEQEYETKLELAFDNYFELISVKEHVTKQQKLIEDIVTSVEFSQPNLEKIHLEIATTIVINTFPQDISKKQYIKTINALISQMFNIDVEEKVNMELLDYFKSLIY